MSNRRRTSSVKIRNKKHDKKIAIGSACVLLLSLVLFLVLPILKLEVAGFRTETFTGIEVMFGSGTLVKSSIPTMVVILAVVVALVLNVIGIFDRRFCLFSGLLLILVAISFIFIKNFANAGEAYSYVMNLKFSNCATMYITLVGIFVSSLGQLYITTSENFE